MTQLHASANPWSADRDPQATARAVLAELAQLGPFLSVTSRHLQWRLYGTDKVGTGPIHSALGLLANDRLVERAAKRQGQVTYRITKAGRERNEGIEAFMGGAA